MVILSCTEIEPWSFEKQKSKTYIQEDQVTLRAQHSVNRRI